MNIPARLGSSNFPTRLVHALATALLLAGCHSGPKRLDELAISRLRPGQTRYEDVVREVDIDPQRDAAFPSHERGAREEFTFGPEWHEWAFEFANHDSWSLEFDPSGVLASAPQHYASDSLRN